MEYHELLRAAIEESGWSLTEITRRMERQTGVKITKSYLSKLMNGKKPPASEQINSALAYVLSPVTSINLKDLRVAAYKQLIPSDVLQEIIEREGEKWKTKNVV